MPVSFRTGLARGSIPAIFLCLLLPASSALADSNHGFQSWSPSCAPNCTSSDVFNAGNSAAAAEADKANGESQKLAGDARERAELADQIRKDRAGLQRQLNQIPPSQNTAAERNAILKRSYVLPEKFKVTGRSLELNTYRDLEARGEQVQKELIEKAKETRREAEALYEKARQGYSAARKLGGMESTALRRKQGMKSTSQLGAVSSPAETAHPEASAAQRGAGAMESENGFSKIHAQGTSRNDSFSISPTPQQSDRKTGKSRGLASLPEFDQKTKKEARDPLTTEKIMSTLDELLLKTAGAIDGREELPPAGAGNSGNIVVALLDSAPLSASNHREAIHSESERRFDPAEISSSELTLFQIMNRRTRAYHKHLAGE